jgi:hypothetical protein
MRSPESSLVTGFLGDGDRLGDLAPSIAVTSEGRESTDGVYNVKLDGCNLKWGGQRSYGQRRPAPASPGHRRAVAFSWHGLDDDVETVVVQFHDYRLHSSPVARLTRRCTADPWLCQSPTPIVTPTQTKLGSRTTGPPYIKDTVAQSGKGCGQIGTASSG